MDYVIAIGINRYKHHWLDALNYCVDDAKSIAEAFDKLLNSNVQVTVLCDEEATFDQIIKCKDAVVFTPDDRLFIFFAGHGKNIEGEPRLLCFDTTEKDVNERKNCIGVTDFIEEVTSKGTDLYFFADACESAIAPRFFSGYSDSARRGIKSKSDEHNCIIGSRGGVAYFSSVDYSESAQEVAPVGHGIWTDALLKALTTDVAYDRGVLTASSLQEYLNSVVKQYIREEGIENIQTPQFLMQSSLEMVLHKDHNQSLVTSNDIPVNYDSYVDIDNYIPRTVRLYKNQEFEEKLDLYSAVKRHKKIVLISNAGSGKTTETRRLAFLLKNDISSDIPVLIKLCRWEGESIERLVERALPGKLGDNHVLIMDGYDEINESNMLDFSHRVKTFIKSHPQIKVVISVRSNRYCIAEKKGEETFSDFSEYLLTDIPDSEIKEFVRRQGINVNEFMQELRIRNLFSMAGNPFYLLGLVNLFKENSKLPQPLDVMGSFILRQLNVDVGRYTDVEDGFDQSLVMHTMMRLAFAMQCRQQVEIDFVRYKEITEDNNQKLVKKTGLIQRNINKWSFVHKNFQEYLAAKYISVFDMATIKRLVTLDPLQQQIGYAWENVLSFLVLLKSSDELIDWLIEVYPECLVQYEVDFKSEALNARVVKGVFEQCEKNNYWLSMIVRSPNAMDSLCSNVSVIDYLLYKIKSRYPNKYRSLANALHLLKRAKDFHGRNNDVRELMFICISDESVRNYEKGIAIEVLGNKNLGLDTDFSMIVSALGGSVDPELRRSLLTFISETKTNEESIQYVLQSCEEINRSEDFWSCSIVLRNCFIAMEDMSAVKTVINYICDNKGLHMSSSFLDEIYGVLFSRAAQFFRNGDRSISDQLLTFYVGCKYWSDRHLHSRITAYIRETGQSRKVFQYCIEHSVPNPLGSLKPILDNELIDEFADRYSRHMLIQPKMFENYVYSLNETCYRYDDLCRCVKSVSGFEIPKRAEDGTLIKTRNAEKRFYDALFEKSSLEILIEELAQCYEDQNIKIGDMELTSSVQDRRDLELLYYMVRRYGDVFKNMTLNEWNSSDSLDFILLLEIKEAMQSGNIEALSTKQEAFLEEYCYDTVLSDDFDDNEVNYNDKGISYTRRSELVAYFSAKLDVGYSISEYYKLMFLPTILFNETHEYYVFTPYILSHVKATDIQKWISTSIKQKKIKGELICRSIKYCLDNPSDICIDLAEQLIMSDADSFAKQIALKYLEQYIPQEKLVAMFIDDADVDLIGLMNQTFQKTNNSLLIEKMISINRESENPLELLQALIERNTQYGLSRYYELATARNSIPDYSREPIISSVTDSIRNVSSVENAEMLVRLCKLATSDGFRDRSAFGLRRSTSIALNNIAKQDQKKRLTVQSLLDKELNCEDSNDCFKEEAKSLIKDIERDCYTKAAMPLDWLEVKEYIAMAEVYYQYT